MKSYKFAIVGAGFMGGTHAKAIAAIPEARVAVVCDPVEATGRALAKSFGAEWVLDYHEAVARDDVDIVSICTPSGLHLEPALAALQAGKHVLVEKPLEITLERADRIIHAADAAGRKLSSIFPYRFLRGVRAAKEAISAGRLGRLALADCYVKWYRGQDYYNGSWHGTLQLDGGGALMNQSIHSIDLLQYLAGPVKSVYAKARTLAHAIQVEDTASALLSYENQALGAVQGSTACWPGDPARIELHGDCGTVILTEGRITTWKLKDARENEEERMLSLEESPPSGAAAARDYSTYEMHRRQIADLIQAIEQDHNPVVDGREARKAIEVIRAIYRSSQLGQAVELPLLET